MARLLVVSRSMALAMRLADVHEVVEHPVEALDHLVPGPEIDVVVLDLGEPALATAALEQIRSSGSSAPILVVSGYQSSWSGAANVSTDDVLVVPLPITRASLLDGVEALVARRRHTNQWAAQTSDVPQAPVIIAPAEATPMATDTHHPGDPQEPFGEGSAAPLQVDLRDATQATFSEQSAQEYMPPSPITASVSEEIAGPAIPQEPEAGASVTRTVLSAPGAELQLSAPAWEELLLTQPPAMPGHDAGRVLRGREGARSSTPSYLSTDQPPLIPLDSAQNPPPGQGAAGFGGDERPPYEAQLPWERQELDQSAAQRRRSLWPWRRRHAAQEETSSAGDSATGPGLEQAGSLMDRAADAVRNPGLDASESQAGAADVSQYAPDSHDGDGWAAAADRPALAADAFSPDAANVSSPHFSSPDAVPGEFGARHLPSTLPPLPPAPPALPTFGTPSEPWTSDGATDALTEPSHEIDAAVDSEIGRGIDAEIDAAGDLSVLGEIDGQGPSAESANRVANPYEPTEPEAPASYGVLLPDGETPQVQAGSAAPPWLQIPAELAPPPLPAPATDAAAEVGLAARSDAVDEVPQDADPFETAVRPGAWQSQDSGFAPPDDHDRFAAYAEPEGDQEPAPLPIRPLNTAGSGGLADTRSLILPFSPGPQDEGAANQFDWWAPEGPNDTSTQPGAWRAGVVQPANPSALEAAPSPVPSLTGAMLSGVSVPAAEPITHDAMGDDSGGADDSSSVDASTTATGVSVDLSDDHSDARDQEWPDARDNAAGPETDVDSAELGSTHLESAGLDSAELNSAELDSTDKAESGTPFAVPALTPPPLPGASLSDRALLGVSELAEPEFIAPGPLSIPQLDIPQLPDVEHVHSLMAAPDLGEPQQHALADQVDAGFASDSSAQLNEESVDVAGALAAQGLPDDQLVVDQPAHDGSIMDATFGDRELTAAVVEPEQTTPATDFVEPDPLEGESASLATDFLEPEHSAVSADIAALVEEPQAAGIEADGGTDAAANVDLDTDVDADVDAAVDAAVDADVSGAGDAHASLDAEPSTDEEPSADAADFSSQIPSDAAATEAGSLEAEAAEPAHTDSGDADAADSDVADSDVADSDVADSDVADSDVADSDVADSDSADAGPADEDSADQQEEPGAAPGETASTPGDQLEATSQEESEATSLGEPDTTRTKAPATVAAVTVLATGLAHRGLRPELSEPEASEPTASGADLDSAPRDISSLHTTESAATSDPSSDGELEASAPDDADADLLDAYAMSEPAHEPSASAEATDQVPPGDLDLNRLVTLLLDRGEGLKTVSELASEIAAITSDSTRSDAVALLLPDDGAWRVQGAVGLRALERRLVLGEGHRLVKDVVRANGNVVIDDTIDSRNSVAGAPLTGWRYMAAVPVPEVDGILVLGRGFHAGAFSQDDLASARALMANRSGELGLAVRTRDLARRLAPLRELDPSL